MEMESVVVESAVVVVAGKRSNKARMSGRAEWDDRRRIW